jgi:hypothetical protein
MKPDFISENYWAFIKRYQGNDFSVVEDSPHAFEIISQIAIRAGLSAQAEVKAAGLPHVFVRDNKIIKLHSDGTEEVIPDSLVKGDQYYYRYSLPKVFHAIKK